MVLQEAIGSGRLGCWPYCVPEKRWNDAAAQNHWLPRSRVSDGYVPNARQRAITDRRVENLPLPSRLRDLKPFDRDLTTLRTFRERLSDGSTAVSELFEQVRRVSRIVLSSVSLIACSCYLAATASWLWALHDGLGGAELGNGIVLFLAALLASWTTSLFETRVPSGAAGRLRLPRSEGRDHQPLLHLALDVYRVGAVLQLLGFAAIALL